MTAAPLAFSLEMNRMRQDTARKLLAAATSPDPAVRARAAFVADVTGSKPARDPNDEHRLTAEQLGVGSNKGQR